MPVKHRTLALSLVAAAALTGCNRQPSAPSGSAGDVVVGAFVSLTGTKADFGITTNNGILLAAEQLNAKGGLLGRRIRVISQDDQGQADQVGTIVTRFVTGDNVDVVIGEVASKLSLRAAPICQKAGVPMISPSSTNPEVTRKGSFIFRVCFIDPFQGTVLAKFARSNLKAAKAAVLRDASNDYSVGLADFFVQEFKRLGGVITKDLSCQEGDDNFRPQLNEIKKDAPDVILVPVYYREVALIARQAREIGITAPLLGGDGWDAADTIKNAGGALEGCYMSNHYSEAQGGPRIRDFVRAYEARYKTKPNALAALGYDAMNIYADAVRRAGSTDRTKVRDALATTKGFAGVTGDITIDSERNALKPAIIQQVVDGKWKFLTTVTP